MATFVLVHGSFQASWCWREVVTRLESRGHRAVAFDLPAHGADRTALDRVTMQDYVEATRQVVRALDEPAILVGHSMGGPIAVLAASQLDTVAAVISVAGLLPPNGASLLQAAEAFDPEYLAQITWAPDRRSVTMSPVGARNFLYPRCPVDLADEAIALMTPEPIAPYESPIAAAGPHFGHVPRYYVNTLRDRVVLPAIQKSIQALVTFKRVFSLDTDHSPFFSAPDDLVACLESAAARD